MAENTKNILVLGAGRVAFPCIEFVAKRRYNVTVVSQIKEELEQVASQLPEVKTEQLDICTNPQRLSELMTKHDLVISLVPPFMQAFVVEHCIQNKTSVVSASYTNENIRKLDQRAKDAGIVVLCECGLDPGLDHMFSKCEIDTIHQNGGKIQSFMSVCGGLPCPKFADEPLKYKFSWNPQKVLLNCTYSASYLMDGQEMQLASGTILEYAREIHGIMDESIDFEDIPNGNALIYQKLYDIPSVTNLYRGTLRYKGYSRVMKSLLHLGLISTENCSQLSASAPELTWREIISHLLKLPLKSALKDISQAWLEIYKEDLVPMETIFSFLGEHDLAPKADTLLDSLSIYLGKKFSFSSHETDLVVMRTEIEYELADGKKRRVTLDLVEEGQVNRASAMSKTVGITAGAVATVLLEGVIKRTGVIIPVYEDIYRPALDLISKEGIHIKKTVVEL